jgi:AraC-like DNA-binding protein
MDTIQPGGPLTRYRIALEQFAAGEILRDGGRTSETVRRLQSLIPEFRQVLESRDYEAFDQTDRRLHRTLVEATGIPPLVKTWEEIWDTQAEQYRFRLRDIWPDLRILVEEQIYLIETLCSLDAVAIEDAIHNHLMSSWFRALESSQGSPAGADDPLVRVTAYLSYNLHRPLRLSDVAQRIAFTSPGHLSRLLRQQCGASFAEYLLRLRMEKGAELLRRTRLPVKHIARRTGYPSASRFCEYFKRTHKVTPNAYRAKSREGR